jgi:hypothetical protein
MINDEQSDKHVLSFEPIKNGSSWNNLRQLFFYDSPEANPINFLHIETNL